MMGGRPADLPPPAAVGQRVAPIRFVGIGYQGFGNLGDEAILSGIEHLIAASRLQLVALLGGNREAISAFPDVARLTSRRVMPGPASVRRLARADGLLVTGGGLIHDHWRVVLLRYLAWVMVARMLRRRIIWLGVGVGPLRRRSWRFLARWVTRLSHLVLVRDAASARLLEKVGGRVDGVVPDPAIFNSPPVLAEEAEAASNHLRPLGLVVRAPAPGGERHASALAEALSDIAAERFRIDSRHTIVYTFAGERDRTFAAQITDAAKGKGATSIRLEELPPDPAVGMSRLQGCEAIVSVRLHGLILAALVEVPFVGIAYDDKVEGVLAELDASELMVPLDRVDFAGIDAALRRSREPEVTRRVGSAVARMRAQQATIVARIEEAMT